MKWFGVDYRYVIAGVGAVFILAYEFVGTQSGEIQPDKQEAQNSKALSVEALEIIRKKHQISKFLKDNIRLLRLFLYICSR